MNGMKLAAALVGSVLSIGAVAPASAATYTGVLNSPSGSFTSFNDVGIISFSVTDSAKDVLIRSWSYAGGTFLDGAASTTVAGGGFDPVLWLYDDNGVRIDRGHPRQLASASLKPSRGCRRRRTTRVIRGNLPRPH